VYLETQGKILLSVYVVRN